MKDLSPPCAVTIWKEMLIPVFGIHFQRASLFNKSGCFLFLCLFLGECPQSLRSQFDRFWRGGGFFHLEALNDLPFGESQIGFQLRLDKDDSSQPGTMLACSFSQSWRRQSRSGPRLGVGEGRGHEVGVLKPRLLGNLTWATGSKIRLRSPVSLLLPAGWNPYLELFSTWKLSYMRQGWSFPLGLRMKKDLMGKWIMLPRS